MNNTYTFSYVRPVRVPKLVRRPWYNIFGRDTIEMVEVQQHECLLNLSEGEGALILEAEKNPSLMALLLRLMGGKVWRVQLEHGPKANNYIATTGGAK